MRIIHKLWSRCRSRHSAVAHLFHCDICNGPDGHVLKNGGVLCAECKAAFESL
jgi:uncharacterized membrane protein